MYWEVGTTKQPNTKPIRPKVESVTHTQGEPEPPKKNWFE